MSATDVLNAYQKDRNLNELFKYKYLDTNDWNYTADATKVHYFSIVLSAQ